MIISSSKYNAHLEPLSKILDILKIEHLFSQSCLQFVYKLKKIPITKIFFIFAMCSQVLNPWPRYEKCHQYRYYLHLYSRGIKNVSDPNFHYY